MKERVLVTGGAGFVGSHLVNALIADGFSVRVLDRMRRRIRGGALPPWMNKKAEYCTGDVRNKNDWTDALENASSVIHLAGYIDDHQDFSTYITVNAASTALLYEVIAEKKYPIKKVIVASSQAVYGEGKYRCGRHGIAYPAPRPEEQMRRKEWEIRCPIGGEAMEPLAAEESDFLKPMTLYGLSKKIAEEVLFDLGGRLGIPSSAARFTIVQGTHQARRPSTSGALQQFTLRAFAGDPITLYEDGRQLRDFVDVRDVASALVLLLVSPRADFQVFNIGSGSASLICDFAKTVSRLAGAAFRPDLPGVYRAGAPRHAIADISKLKKLGWRPRYSYEDTIAEYVGWAKKSLKMTSKYHPAKKHRRV